MNSLAIILVVALAGRYAGANRVPDESADTLRITLDVPPGVAIGAPVPIVALVENVSGRRLDLHLVGRTIAFDVFVARAGGAPVWRRMEGQAIPMILRVESLDPGKSLELRETWDQRTNAGRPVEPGDYTVRVELFTDAGPLASPTVRFRLRR